MKKLKKYGNNELGIYDDVAKKFVPLHGKNLVESISYLRSDVREYFMEISHKDLMYAARVILKSDEDIENEKQRKLLVEKKEREGFNE